LKLKKPKPTPQPCWTPAEVEQIIAGSREPDRPKFIALAETGMRVAELTHLTWDDVDFQHNLLHIRPKDDWQPKTGDQRAIPMSPRLRAVLEALLRRSRWVFTAAPSKRFPQEDRPVSDRRLLAALKRVLKKLALKGHVHTFRHSFISKALTQGIPEAIVREWVGHVDAEVIRLCTHIADTACQAAMRRLAEAINNDLQKKEAKNGPEKCGKDSAQSQHKERSRRKDENAN
jgi:integrase